MCLSCGCGKPDDNHGDVRNITQQDINQRDISLQDLDAAAEAAGTTREKVIENINSGTQSNLPHRAWDEAQGPSDQSEIDYGISRSEKAQGHQDVTPDSDTGLTRRNDVPGHEHLMRDGYAETQGSDYGVIHNGVGRPPSDAQEGYDPAHSGVRHARNQPGKQVDEPGRETGTAWGEDLQMGKTDNPEERRNPAK
jgi:hypothetical protein